MGWIRLTQPKGEPVSINATHIEKFFAAHEGGTGIVYFSGHSQIVQESPKEVLLRLARADKEEP